MRYGTAGWVARAWSFGGAKTNYAMGSIAFLASLVLIITSREIVRRRFYKVFYWAHRLGFWVFIIGGVIHYNSLFWCVLIAQCRAALVLAATSTRMYTRPQAGACSTLLCAYAQSACVSRHARNHFSSL